jgi:monoamine oxidase
MGYGVTVEAPLDVVTAEGVREVPEPLQQSDLLKPFYMDIARYGLSYAYQKYGGVPPTPGESLAGTDRSKHVIIVGAGMAGLVVARELKRVGHRVTILETQERIGGRVKTLDHKDGFQQGLYVDAGAMRLPCPPDDPNKTHFLTDYYGETLFKLKMVPFVNSNEKAFLKFYNMPRIQQEDWDDSYFTKLWPGWDRTIRLSGAKAKHDIKDIDTYYELTTNIIIDQLRVLLVDVINQSKRSAIWNEWVETWCRFPLDGFLQSTKEAIVEQIPIEFRIGLDELDKFLPWPDAAITAYSVFSYTVALDQSLVEYLREQMGHWWSPHMHHIQGGMSELPKAFAAELEENITLNFTVTEIIYDSPEDDLHRKVFVKGYKREGHGCTSQCMIDGHAVIVTTPVNILRQINFVPLKVEPLKGKSAKPTHPLPNRFFKAIEDIWYGPSTKIMIQSKTRFWEKEYGLQGGFTKTNLPIGQIHYPSNPGLSSIPGEGGILLCYTWKSEALLFGALEKDIAIKEAVEQISQIHPQMEHQFDFGAIEAWYNEPSAQGAYALLKPRQYQHVKWLMYPWRNLYFAGEAISFANGWIQGALESGLRAAYQFYARDEQA